MTPPPIKTVTLPAWAIKATIIARDVWHNDRTATLVGIVLVWAGSLTLAVYWAGRDNQSAAVPVAQPSTVPVAQPSTVPVDQPAAVPAPAVDAKALREAVAHEQRKQAGLRFNGYSNAPEAQDLEPLFYYFKQPGIVPIYQKVHDENKAKYSYAENVEFAFSIESESRDKAQLILNQKNAR